MRREAGAGAAVFASGDRIVQAELAAPEVFTAERVVAEDLFARVEHAPRVLLDVRAGAFLDGRVLGRGLFGLETATGETGENEDGDQRDDCGASHGSISWFVLTSSSTRQNDASLSCGLELL